MFKKLLSCLLAVVMLFALAVPALAEDTEARSIEPTMTNIMERTATEWMAEDSSRVLLATCILIDIMLSDYEDLSDIEEVIFDDEDEDEEDDDCDCDCDCCDCYDCYEVTCPACGAIVEADEEILLSDDFSCPNCGEKFEIDFDEDDEEVGVDGEEA